MVLRISKFVLIIYIYSYVNNCSGQRAFTDDQLKWEFPKKEKKYKLSKEPFILSDSSFISANAVYIQTFEHETWENQKLIKRNKTYRYMRFFTNGKVFVSFAYLSYPTPNELKDLNYGKYGYYRIKNNELVVELYMNRQYGIMFMFAAPALRGIQFHATSSKLNTLIKGNNKKGGFYEKKYMEFGTLNPLTAPK